MFDRIYICFVLLTNGKDSSPTLNLSHFYRIHNLHGVFLDAKHTRIYATTSDTPPRPTVVTVCISERPIS